MSVRRFVPCVYTIPEGPRFIPHRGINQALPAITQTRIRRGNVPREVRQGMKASGSEAVWAAFEAEALPLAPGLFRLAMWLERDRTEAEDLVQETLTRGLESFHRARPPGTTHG